MKTVVNLELSGTSVPIASEPQDAFEPEAVIVGAGYVGLTLAIHMAERGLSILTYDIDQTRVSELQQGESAIYETGIRESLNRGVESKRLRFSGTAPKRAPAWILAISYFPGDPKHYIEALDFIGSHPKEPPLIIVRGTVPSGYCRTHLLPGLERKFGGPVDQAFYLASAPERSLSGAALEELSRLPQLVGGTEKSVEKVVELFEKAQMTCVKLPSLEAAEIAKTFINFSRFVQFNLANFLGVLCHQFGVNEAAMTQAIAEGYPRLDFLSVPGPGSGGFCLPKDALVLHDGVGSLARQHADFAPIFDYPKHQFELNRSIIRYHSAKVSDLTRNSKRILALGLAFKGMPHTDDVRGSVGIEMVQSLINEGRRIEVYDRTVPAKKLTSLGLTVAQNPLRPGAYDACLVLNNDPEYKNVLLKSLGGRGDPFVLYDPWRVVVENSQQIFQQTFSWPSLTAA